MSNEFFYIDADGKKQDAALHATIIGPVDNPIDEKIMAPIRARHRAEHIARQNAGTRQKQWQKIKAAAERNLARGRGDVTTMVKIAERAERRLENGQNGLYKKVDTKGTWNEDDHPRAPAGEPDGGQFVGSGGGSGGGGSEDSGKPAAAGTGAGAGLHGGVPAGYSRERPSDSQRGRDVVAVWRPTDDRAADLKTRGHSAHPYYEMAGATGAKTFYNAINRAKAGTHGAAVHTYDPKEYEGMRLFLSPDANTGFALKGNDIVSVFKNPDSNIKGAAGSALRLAVEQGGRRLDAFDTQLPFIYADAGFEPVARLKWNDEYKPEGWDFDTFKRYNDGRPDVVFMTYSGSPTPLKYVPGSGPYVADYDAGNAAQAAKLLATPGVQTPVDGNFDHAKVVKTGWIGESPVKTIDDVTRGAAEAQKMLGDAGRDIAAKHGFVFKDPGPKTKSEKGVQRVLVKAAERGGNLAAVTDTARGSFLIEHPEEADRIIADLGQHFQVAAEPWKRTNEDYFDRSANVRLPNGVIAELQMMHPTMAKAKSPDGGGGHDLYKISRETAETGVTPDPVKHAAAVEQQRELYGKAMAEMPAEWRKLFSATARTIKQLLSRLRERLFR